MIRYWLWLKSISGLGNITINKLLKIVKSPKVIYDMDYDSLWNLDLLSRDQVYNIINNKSLDNAERIIEKCYRHNIIIWPVCDVDFNNRLNIDKDSPAHTSCLLNHGNTIAVLGNGLDICYPIEHK